jgi:glycine cleavage system H protein
LLDNTFRAPVDFAATIHPRAANVSNIPSDLLYTAEHEYLQATDERDVFAVGITQYAQDQLGDIVFVELPKVGASFGAHDTFGTIEAVKAVSELFAPVSGEVTAINEALDADPAAINRDPYGDGWMIKVRLSDLSQKDTLMSPAAYATHIGE